MKYKLYRAGNSIEKAIRKHELISIEYGKDIVEVEDALVKAVTDDLAGDPEYDNCEASAYAPEYVNCYRGKSRYQYEMTGIVYPPGNSKNILVMYGIMEESE